MSQIMFWKESTQKQEELTRFDGTGVSEPMLAYKYEDKQFEIEFDLKRGGKVFTQLKLNGARALAAKTGLFTRSGRTWNSVPHIAAALAPAFQKHPELVLDGELFSEDLKQDLGGLASLILKNTPTANDLKQSAKQVKFYIYDAQLPGTYSERHKVISEIASELGPSVHVLPYKSVRSANEIDQHLSNAESDGHEGIMVRRDSNYESGRSSNLLKYKRWDSGEFLIAGVHEGKGKARGTVAALSVKTQYGRIFKASVNSGSTTWREHLTQIDLVGQMATVQYKGFSRHGIPLMGKCLAIRNYE